MAPRAILILAAAAAWLLAPRSAPGQVVPTSREAIAVRGQPLLVEVRVGPDAKPGPVSLVAGGGSTPLEPRLIWPYLPLPTGKSLLRWASASSPLRFADARPVGASAASLAVEIPADAPDEAAIELGAARVQLAVFDAGPADLLDRIARRASMLVPAGAPDAMLTMPDPDAPLERFRFAIGVPMRGWPAPAPFPPESADALAARAHVALWRAALSRAMQASAGPAVELAESLVASCADDSAPAPIAAWIASPEELRAVLRLAFSRDFAGERLAASVNEFLRVRASMSWWIEESDAEAVTLAVANPTTREQIARAQWLAGTEEDMIPIAVSVAPISVVRQRIRRPSIEANPLAPDRLVALEQLRVSSGSANEVVLAPPARLSIDAGGVDLRDGFAPLNVVAVAPGRRTAVASGSTWFSVRERLTGWEVYFEAGPAAQGRPVSGSCTAVGPDGGLVRIDSDGARAVESAELPADAISFAAYRDRFRASFVLPPEWVRREAGETVAEVGFRRELEGGFADAPFPCVPWRERPRTILLDLAPRQ